MLHSGSVPRTSPCPPSLQRPRFRPRHAAPATLRVSASLPDSDNRFKAEYTPWLIVGLGNPGNKYHGTRHNVGFEMIDRISQAEGILLNTIQSKALIGIGCIGEVPLVLAKPQAYMSFSGESVAPLAAYYQIPLRHILLVYDEMSLPNGVMKLQPKGGHGQHRIAEQVKLIVRRERLPLNLNQFDAMSVDKCMAKSNHLLSFLDTWYISVPWNFESNHLIKNVIAHLDGLREFPRLSIGIGNPPGTMDVKAFLLQKFSSVEREQIDEALDQGVQAVRALVLDGFRQRIRRFNLGQKYKYHKV